MFELVDPPLPVELAPGYRAVINGNRIRITWRTLSETNNAGFAIEQFAGDGMFEEIGFVAGQGTTVTPQDYTFETGLLGPGFHRFRLRQVDFDGTVSYSQPMIAEIPLQGRYHVGDIYPNPFNPQARFTVSVVTSQQVAIQVFDLLGRQVTQLMNGFMEENTPRVFTIDAQDWPGGVYIVQVKGESFVTSRRVTLIK